MNKTSLIETINEKTNYSKEKCKKIVDLTEECPLVGKKNKERLINIFKEELKINEEEAKRLYDQIVSILKKEIKYKIIHPFGRNKQK